MDENLTPVELELNSNEAEESVSVFSGFIDMFTSPWEVGKRQIRSFFGVLPIAVLLEVVAIVSTSYFNTANPAIRQESYQLGTQSFEKLAANPKFPKEKLPEMYAEVEKSLNFNLTKTLGIGIVLTILVIFILTILFWICHRMFTAEPINFVHLVGLVSYGSAISAVGTLVTGLMQFFGNSLLIAPNLGFVAGLSDAGMYMVLSRINIFTVWYYAVIGVAIASAAGLSRKQGYMVGGIVFGFLMLVSFGFMKLMSMLMSLAGG
jgi:hypothetical protein